MTDRRILRTRQVLEHALMDLIDEQGFAALTVQDITDRANIGRATFYLHYTDKDHLLLTIVDSLQAELLQRLQPLTTAEALTDDTTLSAPIFAHIAQHERMYRALLSERGSAMAQQRLLALMARQAERLAVQPLLFAAPDAEMPPTFMATCLSGVLYAAIIWWLAQPQPPTPSAMGRLIRRLVRPITLAMLMPEVQ